MNKKEKQLVVVDGRSQRVDGNCAMAYWAEVDVPDGCFSIPERVYASKDRLRAEYIRFIYDIGESPLGKSDVRGLLKIRPYFSYWWMSLVAEKGQWKSPYLYDIFRMMALVELLQEGGFGSVIFCSENRILSETLGDWCKQHNVRFVWKESGRAAEVSRFHSLPHPLQACVYFLTYIFRNRAFIFSKQPEFGGESQENGGRELSLLTYSDNLCEDSLTEGRFRSGYWGALHELLESMKNSCKVNWIFQFTPSKEMRNSKEAMLIKKRLQKAEASKRENYFFVEEFLSVRLLVKAMAEYFGMCWRSLFVSGLKMQFRLPTSGLDVWKLMKSDFYSSLRGWNAIENLINFELFESLSSKLPHQDKGLFLFENQGWEKAFVATWRAYGHGECIGSQHGALRFFDIRYFEDPRTYNGEITPLSSPLPDIYAANGSEAEQLFIEAGCPVDKISPVEAVRYFHLIDYQQVENPIAPAKRQSVLLIVTDILPRVTMFQLKLLTELLRRGHDFDRILVKPHPSCPVDRLLGRLHEEVEVTSRPLAELLKSVDVVLASNSTAASLEAVYMGVPTLVVKDSNEFVMSPVLDIENVVFVSSFEELKDALAGLKKPTLPNNYFYLDKEMPRWKHVLGDRDRGELVR